METKNYGLIIEPVQPEDFVLGFSQSLALKYGAELLNPSGDWSRFTPSVESQGTRNGDTYACVSFGTTNAVEMLARARAFNDGLNLSDRFLAKVSGTIVGQGNSPKTVADALRHGWSVNEPEWPDSAAANAGEAPGLPGRCAGRRDSAARREATRPARRRPP